MLKRKFKIFLSALLASAMLLTDLGTASAAVSAGGAADTAAETTQVSHTNHAADSKNPETTEKTKTPDAGPGTAEDPDIAGATESGNKKPDNESPEGAAEDTKTPSAGTEEAGAAEIPASTELPENTEQPPEEGTELLPEDTEQLPEEGTELLPEDTEQLPEEGTELLPEDTEQLPEEGTELDTEEILYTESPDFIDLPIDTEVTFTPPKDSYGYQNFKITIPASWGKGFIQVSATGTTSDSSRFGWFHVESGSNIPLTDNQYIEHNQTVQSVKVGVEPGTYYINNYYNYIVHGESSVKFKYTFTADPYWETEPNDAPTTADPIHVNTTYYGNCTSLADESENDYYVFSLDQAGYIDIAFNHAPLTNEYGSYYEAVLYNSKLSEIDRIHSDANELNVQSSKIGLDTGIYYLRVYNNCSNDGYNFKVNYSASAQWEKEINDAAAAATNINVNSVYNGTTKDSQDDDFYRFTIKDNGYVSVALNHPLYGDLNSNYYRVYLYGNDEQITYSKFYSKGSQSSYTDTKIGLPAGTYLVKVEAEHYPAGTDPYQLKVNYEKSAFWETEFNDTLNTADKISLNKTYNGALSSDSDEDYYKFSTSANGYITIDFGHENLQNKNQYFDTALCDKNGNELARLSSKGTDKKVSLSKYGLGKGTYYLKVFDSYYSNTPYTINVSYKKVSNWETETNDDTSAADKISFGKSYSGTTIQNDLDYYKFSLSSKTWINIALSHENTGSTNTHWIVYLCDSKGRGIYSDARKKYFGELSVKGTKTYASLGNIQLGKGTYYVKVSAASNYSATPYQLNVSKVSIKTPTLSSVKSEAYNKLKVTWKAVGGADKYYVYRSTSKNGSYKKVATISAGKTSYTDSKATSGKTYYYKIKCTGSTTKTVTSGYSKVLSGKALPAKPAVTLRTSGSKKVKVSWKKVSGASGYEVYYSTKKSGSYKKAATIKKGSTVSYTKSGLTSKKTYYFKVRTYRTVNDKKIYSSYSSVQSIKVK